MAQLSTPVFPDGKRIGEAGVVALIRLPDLGVAVVVQCLQNCEGKIPFVESKSCFNWMADQHVIMKNFKMLADSGQSEAEKQDDPFYKVLGRLCDKISPETFWRALSLGGQFYCVAVGINTRARERAGCLAGMVAVCAQQGSQSPCVRKSSGDAMAWVDKAAGWVKRTMAAPKNAPEAKKPAPRSNGELRKPIKRRRLR